MRSSILLLLCASLLSASTPPTADQGLALRRIADFWQEGEYQIAKTQMEEFLKLFPDSPYAETLCIALGDLYTREKDYTTALDYYARLQAEAQKKIFTHRMQCLYHLQWHATLADECEAYLKENQELDLDSKLQTTYFLAIALYQQCINAAKDSAALDALAARAKPYFEELSHSELSSEVAQAYAHICSLQNDYQSAARIYLNLASQNPEQEQLLFQAALLQSKYSKQDSLNTFKTIEEKGGAHGKEAAYNRIILSFEDGQYATLIESKESLIHSVPEERVPLVHLVLGKCHLALKEFKEATIELNQFLENSKETNIARPALLHLIEAAYETNDLPILDQAIGKLKLIDQADVELPRALFSRAQLLKKEQNTDAAQKEIENLLASFAQFDERPQASFELAHLASTQKKWVEARKHALSFVEEFPTHELAPFAWRYFVASSLEIGEKEQIISDLKRLLESKADLPSAELLDWTFVLAKANYETHQFAEAIALLEPLLSQEFSQKGNALLLLGLCHRDINGNQVKFSEFAEKSLVLEQTLLPKEQLHVSLFNSYVLQEKIDLAAEHLEQALLQHAEVQLFNLAWLADYAYGKFEKESAYAPKAAELLTQFIERAELKPSAINQNTLYLETLFIKVAKLYSYLKKHDEAISLLHSLIDHYTAFPDIPYTGEKEARLILGEAFIAIGNKEAAQAQFDLIEKNCPTKRNRFAAIAALHSARLHLLSPEKTATILKDLVIQKNFENEPLHLEAALDYIDLQVSSESLEHQETKKLALLTKTKQDFESTDDLLGKDYHAARQKLGEKNQLYLNYMRYFDAAILITQANISNKEEEKKELQAKAKDLLLQLKGESLESPILERVEKDLAQLRL